jgi:hypothetical protein
MKSDKISLVQLNVVEDRLHMALSGAIWFPIWLSWGDDSFPGEKWEDIGVDIISAITAYIIQAPSNGRQTVQFPDGPYRIILGPADNAKLFIRMVNSRLETTDGVTYTDVCADLRKFLNSVILCATRVLDRCIKNGWSGERVDELRQAVDALNHYKNSPKDSET